MPKKRKHKHFYKSGIQCSITPNGELLIYGVVGDEYDELDAKTIIKQVQALGDLDTLTVRINSGGGYVAEGLAVFNFLKSYAGTVNVFIDGLAASMASAIAMAGDTVTMAANALMMVHRPWDLAAGDADKLRKGAEVLDRYEESLVSIYTGKTDKSKSEISAMLAEETWLSADEALAHGFIDEITEPMQAVALINTDLSKFKHAPKEAKAMTKIATKVKPGANEETRAERKRAAEILRTADAANLSTEFAQGLIDSDLSLDEARAQIIDKWAEGGGPEINNHLRVDSSFDNPPFRVQAMSEALACRYSPIVPSEAAREFTNMSVLDMARASLAASGRNPRHMSKTQIIETAMAAHTTSDFPELLTGTGDRILRQAYESAPSGLKIIARRTTAQDFRAKSKLQLGEAPELLEVNESGEFTHGTMAEAKESYSIATFGRIFGLSRQALVNDDLGAFSDMSVRFGRAAATFEAQFIVDLLTDNPTMEDGVVLFHASHKNLAGTGTVLSVTALDAARSAMRLQKGLDGTTPVNATPQYLIVPAALETTAETLVAAINPMVAEDVNPFAGRLTVVVDPRLDADSSTAWYIAADQNAIDTLEYAYLEGEEGPQFFLKEGWGIDGTEFKVRLDFGGGVMDWRGLYKNPGA